jgi:hypothetical protein
MRRGLSRQKEMNSASTPNFELQTPQFKSCDSKSCARAGEQLPLSEFHVNRARKDGHDPYCKPCRLAMIARYRLSPGKQIARKRHRETVSIGNKPLSKAAIRRLPINRRLIEALRRKPMIFRDLKAFVGLNFQEMSDALTVTLWQQGKIASRNGTGPRVYLLAPPKAIPPSAEERQQRAEIQPLSFSSLHLPTTPIIRGALARPLGRASSSGGNK